MTTPEELYRAGLDWLDEAMEVKITSGHAAHIASLYFQAAQTAHMLATEGPGPKVDCRNADGRRMGEDLAKLMKQGAEPDWEFETGHALTTTLDKNQENH